MRVMMRAEETGEKKKNSKEGADYRPSNHVWLRLLLTCWLDGIWSRFYQRKFMLRFQVSNHIFLPISCVSALTEAMQR
jgi:hypothetical protein